MVVDQCKKQSLTMNVFLLLNSGVQYKIVETYFEKLTKWF